MKDQLNKIKLGSSTVNIKITDFEGNKTNFLGINDLESIENIVNFFNKRKEEIYKKDSRIEPILNSYINCALWSEGHDEHNIYGIEQKSKEKAINDIAKILMLSDGLLDGLNNDEIGHDLWLTRNGHGTGFWDRGIGERGEKLSEISKELGDVWLTIIDENEFEIM